MMTRTALSWAERLSAPVGLTHRRSVVACVVLCAIVLIGQGLFLPVGDAIAGAVLVSLLVWASAVDIERHTLPNALVLPLIAAGLIWAALDVSPGMPSRFSDCVVGAALGYGALAAFAMIYRARRGIEGLGFGDVKLFSAAGAWVGWTKLPSVMLIAAGLALASYAVRFAIGDKEWRHKAIAFGPFIAVGIWLVWVDGA